MFYFAVRNRLRAVAATVLALCATGACTRAQLEPIPPPENARADNKLAVSGSFCTTNPDSLQFPVKILFLIDTSTSMETTDPLGRRVEAITDVINQVAPQPGVEIAILGFGLGVQDLTAGFLPPEEAINNVVGAGLAAGTTDFVSALSSAITVLATDMAGTDALDRQNARYVIMFLSDGLPDVDSRFNPEDTCTDAALWEQSRNGEPPVPSVEVIEQIDTLIGQISALARQYDVRDLSFNTAFAAQPETDSQIKACGATLMRAMAKKGGGVFRDFSSGEDINFLFVDFTSFKRVFALKNFTATNLNARPFSAALGVDPRVRSDDPTLARGIIDSDGDGIADEVEDLVGSDPRNQDTDNDGFADLLEYNLRNSGFDINDPTDADCKADQDKLDHDGDGLRDCEELFFGTLPDFYDSDLDGFGDGIEVLYGSKPGLADTLLDVDFDGVGNAGEMRAHSRVDVDDVVELSEHAYRYKVVETGIEGSQLCYSFDVTNIALASTSGADDPSPSATGMVEDPGLGGGAMLSGENRIILEATESPFDAPSEPGVPRLACVRARFNAAERLKDPANGKITLDRSAFKPATEFDPAVDCVDP